VSDKPWLAQYDSDVARSLAPYPDKTLLDYLALLARNHGDKPALLFKGASMSYGQLAHESDAFAAALAARGIRPGDRVALILPNAPQFFVAQFGAWKAGAIVAPLNPTYTERELEEALNANGAEVIVTLTAFYDRVKAIRSKTRLRVVIASSIKEYLPPLLRLLFTLFKEKKTGHHASVVPGDFWFQDLLRQHRGTTPPAVIVRPDDRAVILASGGTTGTPKGVVGLHRHYVAAGLQLFEWTKSAREPWVDSIMLPLPMFHVYANVGVQTLAFIGPNPVSLVPNPRDIPDVLKTIAQVKPAFFNGVPTLYNAIIQHPDVQAGKIDLSCIRLCFSGAAALMSDTKKQFEALTRSRIVEGYSLTEAMMACCVNPVRGTNKVGSIGIPLPDVEVRVVDADDSNQEMPLGEVGEMLFRAPQLMAEYWGNPAETTDALRTHGPGGPWLHTGDLVRMDADGFIFIVDRKKDMLKTSGHQVWPTEIEEVLTTHPGVIEAAVAGVPDEAKGEVAHAWVVLRAGASATAEELRAYCRERLAPYKVPAHIEFRKELPKTMVGKILRRELVANYRAALPQSPR
jgi:long-chain acyl-CoA synthetase